MNKYILDLINYHYTYVISLSKGGGGEENHYWALSHDLNTLLCMCMLHLKISTSIESKKNPAYTS